MIIPRRKKDRLAGPYHENAIHIKKEFIANFH